ncbi:MAG TPA: 3-deoxy-7-phosphoheptulonate synthase [Candidatus Avalokitesvara rifleensis]|uniref:3-deoxy-7-phosphoheptulonate synthase n=1 Tax=Candidatus Avalokitesvara rifleensis TaxID=3367620 RepID=UPI0008D43605|nr:3-deoxy-7-phosphoheptulonate synthase [Candidatus Brocadiales bacterium]OHB92253.1 MAG: 3-deoxy-7-phosphoheptulonate synthase [Planctomycetes bacterium RIFCSPHIGHO2_12_FULL_51_37]
MIIVLKKGATEAELQEIVSRIEEHHLSAHVSKGEETTVIGVVGIRIPPELPDLIERLPGVERTMRISKPYKLASREFKAENTVIKIGDVRIGGGDVVIMAGPCSIESRDQLLKTAKAVKKAGAHVLRGGAFKPRTSPYSFRGMGEDGLRILKDVGAEAGLKVVTEVMTLGHVELVARYADILQIGTRNMQNYQLLEEVGRIDKPCVLKRGMSATIEEWLLSAEYIMGKGNKQVILCERGIRTFETATRNTLDLSSIPVVKKISHLPIICDPSHATGKWYLVPPMTFAALGAGADGLLIEVHPDPDHALSDGAQSLTLENFSALMKKITPLVNLLKQNMNF